MEHFTYILFLFVLGACVGSFLNVVVWRLPRGESLVSPPSHCPKCNTRLAWYDNIPIFGWLALRGKCRYCSQPIAKRYPIIEAITGLLFAGYYILLFVVKVPTGTREWLLDKDWPIFALYLFLASALLASSLIDAELFIIPVQIPWLLAGVGIIVHAIIDFPTAPGALNISPPAAALAFGAAIGLLLSIGSWLMEWLPMSFPQGEPLLEIDRDAVAREIEEAKGKGEDPPPLPPPYTRGQIRFEMNKEMLFLLPPMVAGGLWLYLCTHVGPIERMWAAATHYHWFTGLLGSILGALVGAFVVWLTRILGTLGFGRVAMGLGDVHLMFGVGAIIGAGAATVSFFLAPFFGILIALYMLFIGTRRELPYGPYLSLATAFVMLYYHAIVEALGLAQGMEGLIFIVHNWTK